MKLPTMAKVLRELLETSPGHQLSLEEKNGFIVDRECTDRDTRRLKRRIREAKVGQWANVHDIVCEPSREFEKSVLREFRTNQWARSQHNIILVGPTGIGKSFLASALAENACRHGFRAMFCRVPHLKDEFAVAKVAGHYAKTLDNLSRVDVPVLDEFLLAPKKESERRDLLEIPVDRYDRSSTIFRSQVPTKEWHEALADPSVADAICDRIVHNAHIVVLRGHSMRRKKSLQNKEVATP
jgi:DNA replication protein DnaC